jgi:hypothetical protein
MGRIALVIAVVTGSASCSQILGLDDVTLGDAGALANAGPPPVQRSDPAAYTISATVTYSDAEALATALKRPKQTVNDILVNANRSMQPLCHTGPGDAIYPLVSVGTGSYGFCWTAVGTDTTDPDGTIWVPQGITTSRDANGVQLYDGREAAVITWHSSGDTSARITVAPAHGYGDATGTKYRTLLLVAPKTGPDFTEVPCHAGGAMWYGHLLYLACSDAIKIFDWNYVYSADSTPTPNRCDPVVGKLVDPSLGTDPLYCASGYRYLMMQVGQIANPSKNVQFSSISLDQASVPNKLVVAEYALDAPGKLIRFNLDAATRLPSGASAADAYDMPFTQVQGATTQGDKFWFHSSGGVVTNGEPVADKYGKLRFWNSSTGRFAAYTSLYGAEALSFWPGDPAMPDMPDMLYTLSERPGYRAVIAVRTADFE